ncbi:MAG TPA: hypothetical protein VFH66_13675 [Mycobacteriales bacterium]|nr:hypothetical protein [Mycobacteriales bacterium]
MRPVRVLRPLAMAGVVATLAACGSTVQMGPTAVGAANGQQGLSAPAGGAPLPGSSTAPNGVVPGGSAPGGAAPGGGPGTTTTGTTSSGTTSGSSVTGAKRTTSSSGVVANAPGITADTVYLGVKYSSQAGSADQAIGASGAAPSYDFRNVMNAVIDYANAHGGFAGRKLKALYYDYNLSDPQDTQDQSACAYWTQDNKTFAVPAEGSDIMRACAEKAGAVSFGAGGAVASTYQKSPHYIDVNSVRLDRLGPMTVNGLFHAGYFAGKLGFVTWDDPNYRFAYSNGYVPTLASHGIKVTDAAFVKVPQTLDAVGEMSATMSSIVTKFRTDGIDHVIIQDGHAGVWAGTGLTLEFMDQAESQKYYPRYGQNSDNSPGWSGLPSDQQDKAIAVLDTDYEPKDDAGWHPNQARQLCWKIEADAGYPVSSSNVNDEGLAAQACDQVFFLQDVINRLKVITSDTFMQEVDRLGRSFPSALVYGTQFGPGLHDGSAAIRQAEYSSGCQCLTYSGAPYYP